MLPIFRMGIERGQFVEDQKLSDGSSMTISKVQFQSFYFTRIIKYYLCREQIYPLDATFDTKESIPEKVATGKRYRDFSGYSIQEVVEQVKADFGTIDYLVHSLANGPEVTKPLLETSREGYLAANSASAYSLVSMVQKFAPIMNPGKYIIFLSFVQ